MHPEEALLKIMKIAEQALFELDPINPKPVQIKSVVTNPNQQPKWNIGSYLEHAARFNIYFGKSQKTRETIEEFMERNNIKPLDIDAFQAPPIEKEIPYTEAGTSRGPQCYKYKKTAPVEKEVECNCDICPDCRLKKPE